MPITTYSNDMKQSDALHSCLSVTVFQKPSFLLEKGQDVIIARKSAQSLKCLFSSACDRSHDIRSRRLKEVPRESLFCRIDKKLGILLYLWRK